MRASTDKNRGLTHKDHDFSTEKRGLLVQKMQVVIIDWMIPENFLVPIRSSFFSLSSRRPLDAAASLLRGAAPAPGCDTGNRTVVEPDFKAKNVV